MRSNRFGIPPVRPRVRGALVACASALAFPLLIGSCDGDAGRLPLEPEPSPEAPREALVCTADVRAGTLSCSAPEAQLPDGAQGALTVGGQGQFVTLAATNVCFEDACTPAAATGIFQADVTVKNLIGQALGTTDGTTGDAAGVRIFFASPPAATGTSDGQPGTVDVANADGTGTFTAMDQAYFQYGGTIGGADDDALGTDGLLSPDETSAAKTWQWQLSSNVLEFTFAVYVWGEVQYQDGWIDVSPATAALGLGAGDETSVTLAATVRDALGRTVTGTTVTWSSSDTDVATVNASTGEVTAVGAGTATITATDGTRSGTAEITVATSLTDDAYPETVTGNVAINSANVDGGAFSVVANDAFVEGETISFAGWNGTAGRTEQGGDVAMTTSGAGMGQFTYDPPAGYTGTDHFDYVIGDDTARVTLTIEDMVWFVNNNASACTSVASGCGRLSSPFSSLAAFNTANDGLGNDPADGDAIFLYESGTAYTGPLTLRAGQMLIGQDATGSLSKITGITPSASSAPLPATDASTPDATHAVIAGASGGIVLRTDNTLRGLTIATTAGAGLAGNGFGTLTLDRDIAINVTNGAAVDLANGTLDGIFLEVSANGGTNGIKLTNISGSFTIAPTATPGVGGVIQNMSGDGILADGTDALVLNWMTIQNNGGHGINGNNVAGFSLRNSTLDSNGDADDEHGVHFTGLTGAAEISNTSVTDSRGHGVFIENTAGTLTLTIDSDTISAADETTTLVNRAGIFVSATGTATINVTALDNDVTMPDFYDFRYLMAGGGGGHLEIGNNTFSGESQDAIVIAPPGGTTSWSGSITYDIFGNKIGTQDGNSILILARGTTATANMAGYIRGNTIGGGTWGSCGFFGIQLALEGDGTHTASVTDNQIDGCEQEGITVHSQDGAGRFNATILNNDIRNLDAANSFDSFGLYMGAKGDVNQVCLVLGGGTTEQKNEFDLGALFGAHLYFEQPDAATTIYMPGFTVSGGGLAGDVLAYVVARNSTQGGEAMVLDATSQVNNVMNIPSCPTPGFAP
ncbi:MAG TPA: Ig-like domain-containing protein [Longimicrobiales bacterium]